MNFNIFTISTFALLFLVIINLSSCNKTFFSNDFDKSLTENEADLTFEQSSYTITTEDLANTDNSDYYTKGTIIYTKDGKELAKVEFGDGTKDDEYSIKEGGVSKKHKQKKKDKYNFEKVIVQPIVKTNDCDFPTSGIVDYFKNGEWIATVDFGDGTCDDLATKTYDGGSKTFNIKELYKKKK